MSSNIRSWLVWLIPVFVSLGMAIGGLIGMSNISDAAMQEGPAGDIAGAAGALMVIICLAVGFVMALLTIIATKILRRSVPSRIALRIFLSFIGGGIIGMLGACVQNASTAVAWLLLICGPILLAWFCGAGARVPAQDSVVVTDPPE